MYFYQMNKDIIIIIIVAVIIIIIIIVIIIIRNFLKNYTRLYSF